MGLGSGVMGGEGPRELSEDELQLHNERTLKEGDAPETREMDSRRAAWMGEAGAKQKTIAMNLAEFDKDASEAAAELSENQEKAAGEAYDKVMAGVRKVSLDNLSELLQPDGKGFGIGTGESAGPNGPDYGAARIAFMDQALKIDPNSGRSEGTAMLFVGNVNGIVKVAGPSSVRYENDPELYKRIKSQNAQEKQQQPEL